MKNNTVYSTDKGRHCPNCGNPADACTCASTVSRPAGSGKVKVRLETKGRKGKGVTVIDGLALNALELAVLAKKLKTLCGSGGTVKDGMIEIQGDRRDRVTGYLREAGFLA